MILKNVISLIIAVVLIMGVCFPGHAMYVGNYSEGSFDELKSGSGESMMGPNGLSAVTIEYLIIKSATNFLKGKAYADWLAANLEASDHNGIDYLKIQATVDDALFYMRKARYYYRIPNDRAEKTPYNDIVINKLLIFDYKSFAKRQRVNRDIFNQLKRYLRNGNVRGGYFRLLKHMDKIVDELENIQVELYCWVFPKEECIWRLNQECARMLLFGQYMARVFYAIKSEVK